MDQDLQRRVVNKRLANRVIEAMATMESLTAKIATLAGQADLALAPLSAGERASQPEIMLRATTARRDLAEINAHAAAIGREVAGVFDARRDIKTEREEL